MTYPWFWTLCHLSGSCYGFRKPCKHTFLRKGCVVILKYMVWMMATVAVFTWLITPADGKKIRVSVHMQLNMAFPMMLMALHANLQHTGPFMEHGMIDHLISTPYVLKVIAMGDKYAVLQFKPLSSFLLFKSSWIELNRLIDRRCRIWYLTSSAKCLRRCT